MILLVLVFASNFVSLGLSLLLSFAFASLVKAGLYTQFIVYHKSDGECGINALNI